MDAEVSVFQVRERAAQIVPAPVGFLGISDADCLGQCRIIGKKRTTARAFVPERRGIILRRASFAGEACLRRRLIV